VKYFTPELLADSRASDPDVAEAAAVKWLRRADAYRKRLKEIHDRLLPGVRKLLRSVTLHDARLLTLNFALVQDQPRYFLSFQLAGEGGAGIQLRYDVVKPLKVVFHDPKASIETELFVLYDEFDVLAGGTLTHSLLMTRGVELRLRFTNLHITYFKKMVMLGRERSNLQVQLQEFEATALA
jgi:hypothetical protein